MLPVRKCPTCGWAAFVTRRARVNTDPPCLLVRTLCVVGHECDTYEDLHASS